ncbi:MAG: fumarylacetoacetate hydrolase family protein, partial [Desulfobacterales bacterium]|nr:fumarylacetoacetate hydrolase family protein [Desulfobacterales bacterium]
MKLVTCVHHKAKPQIGVLSDNDQSVILLQRAVELLEGAPCPFFNDMLSFLKGGGSARTRAWDVVTYVANRKPAHTALPLTEVQLLAPLPQPESIRVVPTNEQEMIHTTRQQSLKSLARFDTWLEKTFGRERSFAYRLNKIWYQQPRYYKANRFAVVGADQPIIIPSHTQHFDYEIGIGIFIGKSGKDIPIEDALNHIGG